MNRTRAPRWGGVVFFVYLSFASAACSDSRPTAPVDEPFDPTFAVDVLGAVTDALVASELSAMISNVNFTFSQDRGSSETDLPGQGQTYAFSENDLRWMIDPGRSGAPADGVRFVWYAMNTGANSPERPLVERGWVDLRMTTTGETDAVMTVEFMELSGTRGAEYTIELHQDLDTGSFLLTAEGTLGTGAGQVGFDVNRSFAYDGEAGVYEAIAAFGGPMGSASVSITSPFDPETHMTVDDSPFTGGLLGGGHYLLIDGIVDVADNVDGTVEADDEDVLSVGGTMLAPVFLLPGGGSPTSVVQSDMEEVWEGLWGLMNEGVLLVNVLEQLFR